MNRNLKFVIFAIVLFSQASLAAAVARVDAKKTLRVQPGLYEVVKADTALDDDIFCVKGAKHTVEWNGSDDSPQLSFGNARMYRGFNTGLRSSSFPEDKQQCKFRHSTQAEAGRLIDDSFTNCLDQNTTTHTEITFTPATIEYSAKVKVSHDGKVLEAPSKCTLKKIDAHANSTVPAANSAAPGHEAQHAH